MKTAKFVLIVVVLILGLAIYSVIAEIHHSETAKKVEVVIKLEKVNGEKCYETFSLPYDFTLKVLANKGSYYLAYCQTDYPLFAGTHWSSLKYGVIDYEVMMIKE